MTWIAVVRVAVAEPERNRAAPFALEVNVVCTVLFAVFDSSPDQICRALRTDEVFAAVLSSRCHLVATVVQAAKVRLLALETHVVGTLEHRKRCQISIEAVVRVPESFVLVKTFKFCSLHSLCFDDAPDLANFGQFLLDRCAVGQIHRLFATWTVHKSEDNARRCPLVLYDRLDAFDVEDVAAAEFDARLRPKSAHPADCAKGVLVDAFVQDKRIVIISCSLCCLARLPSAVRIEAGQALLFAKEATTWVTARMHFVAVLPNHFLALFAKANVLESSSISLYFFVTLVGQLSTTEATLLAVEETLVLLAVATGVVGTHATAMAKVFVARSTPHAILAHVDASTRRHNISIVILLVVVNLSLDSFKDVPAGALCQVLGTSDELLELGALNFFNFLCVKISLNLVNCYGFLALWTL